MRGVVVLIFVVAACTTTAGPSTTRGGDVGCQDPPANEVEQESPLMVTVDPNPATALSVANLSVSGSGLADEAVIGVDARWQCWDGSAWVTTHTLYRGFGDNAGETIAVTSGIDIEIPDIGLFLDDDYPVVIPQVSPGVYRIEDEVITDGGPVTGFVIVEVVEGSRSALGQTASRTSGGS